MWQGCLYNVARDPHEREDMASTNPDMVASMQQKLATLVKGMWSQPAGT